MLVEGLLLGERYRLQNRIATGGMGDVWRCRDTVLERDVAVKVLVPGLVADPQFVARFQAEARIMAALRHPGVVQVHDFGEASLPDGDRVSYLVMEYVEGESVLERVARVGSLSIGETLSIVAQTAQALHAAHTAGIVHRDVKPGNLLVQPNGAMVLVDFGVARSAFVSNNTAHNIVLGTAYYMSPEQAAGHRVTPATDIYALGAVAYCCLTGRAPFDGDNPVQVALRHMREQVPPLPPEVPAPVAALIARALAKDPAARYRTAAEFADAARAIQHAMPGAAQAVVARPASGSATSRGKRAATADEPTVRDPRQRRLALIGGGGVALVALLVLVTTTALRAGPPAGSEEALTTTAPTSATASDPAGAAPNGDTPGAPGVTSRQPTPTPSASVTAKPTATPSATGPVHLPLPSGYTVKTRTVLRHTTSAESYDRYIDIYNSAGTLVGSGEFMSDPLNGGPGDAIRACDKYGDGYGVELRMDINQSGAFQQADRVATTRGHTAPYCSSYATGDLTENTPVALKLCLIKGTTEYCTGTYPARS